MSRTLSKILSSFTGLCLFTFGALLLMTAERPELRSYQGETAAGRAISSIGSGSSAVGSAILGYHAVVYARRQGRGAAPPQLTREAAPETRSGERPL